MDLLRGSGGDKVVFSAVVTPQRVNLIHLLALARDWRLSLLREAWQTCLRIQTFTWVEGRGTQC